MRRVRVSAGPSLVVVGITEKRTEERKFQKGRKDVEESVKPVLIVGYEMTSLYKRMQ